MTAEAASADQQLSSLVWICTSTHSISKVTVIDANNPADVLECFHVCSSHLLCIASVPGNILVSPRPPSCPLVSHVLVISGAKEDDYEAEEEPSRARTEEPTPTESSSTKKDAEESGKEAEEAGQEERRVSDIGSISFVSCATGEDAMTSLGGNQETEEGINYCHKYFCSCFFVFVFFYSFIYHFRGKDKTDKRNSR